VTAPRAPRELSPAQRRAVALARRLVTPDIPGHAELAERLGMPGAPPAAIAGALAGAVAVLVSVVDELAPADTPVRPPSRPAGPPFTEGSDHHGCWPV
jgi:hypothetical protein